MATKLKQHDTALIAAFTSLPLRAQLHSSDGIVYEVTSRHPPFVSARSGSRPWAYTLVPAGGGNALLMSVYDLIGEGFTRGVV